MSDKELLYLAYGFARFVCRYTALDYEDVAHEAILKCLPGLKKNQIEYIRSYIYRVIVNVKISLIRKAVNTIPVEAKIIDRIVCYENTDVYDLEYYRSRMKTNEKNIVDGIVQGYSRKEISILLGIKEQSINLILHRMIKRIGKN